MRYRNSETNQGIVSIKKKIIELLHTIMDFQNDIRLTRFLIEYNKSDNQMFLNPGQSTTEL